MPVQCQQISPIDIEKAQRSDSIIGEWIYFVERNRYPKRHELQEIPESNVFRRNFDKFKVIDRKLYREITTDSETTQQLVVPPDLVNEVLRSSHNNIGHPGRDKTTSFIRDRFFWPGMTHDIEEWIKGCKRCLLRKSPTNSKAPLVSIKTSEPLELVCLDYLTLETSKGGYQHILVITDHFTKYAVAIQLEIKLLKQLLTPFTTTLYFTMDFLNIYTQIKALPTNPILLRNFVLLQA